MSQRVRTMSDPALVLGAREAMLEPAAALSRRIHMVLETRPGRTPWRPDFGCDLSSLTGQPATGATMQLARMRIEEALKRWVPEVELRRVDVTFATDEGRSLGRPGAEVPAAEAALMRVGAQGWLDVRLDLVADIGPLRLNATVRP